MLLFLSTILSCKKGDTGPQGDTGNTGPQGVDGPQGPQGISGNANVIMYTYNGPISMTIGTDLTLSNVTQARMDSSLVLAYYIPAAYSTDWYPIPGVGGYGTSVQYQTIYSLRASTGNKFILSLRLFNASFTAYNGSTVVWNKIKVIVAPASSILPGGRRAAGAPAVDLSDYHAVVKYFNLTE
ncbi:hypothetical protein [Paraflavitalea speifideaquila]|uniref:collagen-like triple helix repeat-containing protein n=1 Tax=Paraflavitalea speifideaquila TaxID=3076558 RepID=UPI0028F16DB1|nr:hypothetical protein [Paraflavitalea speifideiaquila]